LRVWLELYVVDELFGQSDCGFVGKTKKGGVGDSVELLPDGLVDRWMSVTVKVGPDRGVAVEVSTAIRCG
jgi:hypothetical protein